MAKRNQALIARFHAAKAAKQGTIPSDDGEDADPPAGPSSAAAAPGAGAGGTPRRAGGGAGAGAGAVVSSPRLPGVDDVPLLGGLQQPQGHGQAGGGLDHMDVDRLLRGDDDDDDD